MISQFFVLTQRGDSIISRDFRGDIPREAVEIFFRKVKLWKGDAPPIFNLDGINYLFTKKNGLYFVCTTRLNVSPALILELLSRVTRVFKDYCGVLTEESLRMNFVLIYELLDEILDYGYPQGTSSDILKMFVQNEPILVDNVPGLPSLLTDRKTIPSTATNKPIVTSNNSRKNRKDEIFLDIFEKLSVIISSNGSVLNSEIFGTIQMKSYLAGNPELRLGLNEDLIIGKRKTAATAGYASAVIDDCNFHESVNVQDLESDKSLIINPPDGEFCVMNYRVAGDFKIPFRVNTIVEETAPSTLEVSIKVRADLPETHFGNNVFIRLPIPKSSVSTSTNLPPGVSGQSVEVKNAEKLVVWNIRKFAGGSEHILRIKVMLNTPVTEAIRKEIGPISMEFELPMYVCSNIQVRFLRVVDRHRQSVPHRWVRYITSTNSYISRV
eukprot:TRINITY_DN15868_c0_g1_i1.p1 TRINITY_DN15868_c0_g1~~TRINITY_DN15868_c0_g1_i1.p1  ORF type:complete len:439 (-),score=91.64 TRINITY_DN15868_c0_g1_i1:137-1453(-)